MFDGIRLNWFLGIFALEMWGAAWFIAFEPELRRWWHMRRLMRQWRHNPPPRRRARG